MSMDGDKWSFSWRTVIWRPRWDWDLSKKIVDVHVERSDNGVKYRTEYGTKDRRDI